MLNRLFIKNYALIENLDIQFDTGLNIVTGETGAGKSIMMGALGLILGNRAEGKHFFRDDQKCVIEGFFKIDTYGLESLFREHDIEYEDETIIRREITVDGKSRAFVNDSPVTLNILKLLGEQLIDIHSQHATLQLNTERFQLMVLDSVAKNHELLLNYRRTLAHYKQQKEALAHLREEIASVNATMDFNQFQFDELDQANLDAGEQEQLEAELNQLENAEEIKRGLLGANYRLSEGEHAITLSLNESLQHLQTVQGFMPSVGELTSRLQSAWIEIKDIADEVSAKEQEVFMDENRLLIVNERLSLLYSLQQKHRMDSVADLIALRDQLEQNILAASSQDAQLSELEQAVKKNLLALEKVGKQLHATRQDATAPIETHVQEVLAEVGMPHAQLKIEISLLESVDKYKMAGADDVQFLFSANKGQSLQPIHRVASGGELSRVMLAVKSLVAQTSALPTIIFDEIDTGISGEVALNVGDIMERLTVNMQVLAITHLPQIAAKGRAHFKVFKEDDGEKTKTDIVLLDKEKRMMEIAKMLSGANPGASALQHAKELLEKG